MTIITTDYFDDGFDDWLKYLGESTTTLWIVWDSVSGGAVTHSICKYELHSPAEVKAFLKGLTEAFLRGRGSDWFPYSTEEAAQRALSNVLAAEVELKQKAEETHQETSKYLEQLAQKFREEEERRSSAHCETVVNKESKCTPEEMDRFFDRLTRGPAANQDKHGDNSSFLALRDFIHDPLNNFSRNDNLEGSVSWRDHRRTIWKLVFYETRPWLFGVRREVGRLCPQLSGLVTHRFWVQTEEFVGIEVKDDEESRVKMAALVQAVRESDAACEHPESRLTNPRSASDELRSLFVREHCAAESPPPFAMYSRNRRQIKGADLMSWLDNWLKLAPPAAKEKHWKDGRSSKELARCWYRPAPCDSVLPEAVAELLGPWGFLPAFGIAEYQGGLDGFGGNTRNHDLLLPGISQSGIKTLVTIEAKADESFGEKLIGDYRAERERVDGSKVPQRIDRLIAALFGRKMDREIASLRYQLLHAVGSTLIEARRFQCTRALFLVHEFRSTDCKPVKLLGNSQDLKSFMGQLAQNSPSLANPNPLEAPFLLGPFCVPGDPPANQGEYYLPGDVELYIGKVVTDLGGYLTHQP